MKNIFVSLIVLLAVKQALACDISIQKFSRDCALQDRLQNIRTEYAKLGVDVDEIGEYKILRFIDRSSWEKAKIFKKAPVDIYDPAPATWQVWESGIDSLFKGKKLKHVLFTGEHLDQTMFSHINTVLLTNGTTSIKDKSTDQKKKPGEFRFKNDKGVGFCAGSESEINYRIGIKRSEDSMERYQKRWESLAGIEFREVVKNAGGPDWHRADLKSGMFISQGNCRGYNAVFIAYSPSNQVESQVEWIRIFIKTNLEAYGRGEAILSPVELAAVVQKWFVSVHPFSDGNGRTSRGVQDMIMANFGLPFVPAGDLQEDAMTDVEKYIENTYQKLESMLTTLEDCVQKRDKWRVPRACRTIEELNRHLADGEEAQAQRINPGL